MDVDHKDAAIAVGTMEMDRNERFQNLVRDERDHMVAVAYNLVGGDREAAKDVAQEGFLRAYRALSRFRGEASLRTWLTRIVINEASRYRRRQAMRARIGKIWRIFTRGTTDSRSSNGAVKPRIAEALGKLSRGQRQAFALVHFEGMTVEKAAEALGRSPGTIKSHIHRALVSLRRELADLDPQKGE